jgi:hypothetical protein
MMSILELDQIWTQHLRGGEVTPQADGGVLFVIAAHMERLLAEIRPSFALLTQSIVDNHEYSERAYRQALEGESVTTQQREKVEQVVRRAGGLVQLAQATSSAMERAFPEEVNTLHEKMRTIVHDQRPQGDLTKESYCNIAVGVLLGGMFTGNVFVFGVGAGLLLASDC